MNERFRWWGRKIGEFSSPERIRYTAWEALWMRVGMVFLLAQSLPYVRGFGGQPVPNGLARWMDFTFLSNPTVMEPIRWVFIGSLVFYFLGYGMRVVVPIIFAIIVAEGTLGNSQGAINHVTQVLALVLLGQILGMYWEWFQTLRKKREKQELRKNLRDGWISGAIQALAAVYVVSGIVKLINSEGDWIKDVPNFAVQLVKASEMALHNTANPPDSSQSELMVWWMGEYPNLARMFFGSGLVLELGAVLALLNRRWALVLGLSLLAMHETISKIMHLGFYYNKVLLIIFCVNLPYWLRVIWEKRTQWGQVLMKKWKRTPGRWEKRETVVGNDS